MGWNAWAAAGAMSIAATLVLAMYQDRGRDPTGGTARIAESPPGNRFMQLRVDPDGGVGREAALPPASARALDREPAELIVLGDSLSDTGNAAAVADFLLGEPMYPEATIGFCNPVERLLLDRDCVDLLHGRTRVTNGPVAVERLAERLGGLDLAPSFHIVPERPVSGTNYAVAGAKARGAGPQDLAQQLDLLLLDREAALPADALVVVMIGGNDAIDALQSAALPSVGDPAAGLTEDPPDGAGTEPPADVADDAERVDDADAGQANGAADAVVDGATRSIAEAVARLVDHGALCIVVANVPDLALLPAVRSAAAERGIDEAAAEEAASVISTDFNRALEARLGEIEGRAPSASIIRFDLAAALDAAAAEAEAAGVNVRDACFDSEAYADANGGGERRFHPDCAPPPGEPPRFDRFFFWDEIHPTASAHAVVGDALADAAGRCTARPTDR